VRKQETIMSSSWTARIPGGGSGWCRSPSECLRKRTALKKVAIDTRYKKGGPDGNLTSEGLADVGIMC